MTNTFAHAQQFFVVEPQKPEPRIVMHSLDGCGPCNAWFTHDKPRWERVGWRVEKVFDLIAKKREYPWFEIVDRDGSKFQVDGPLTKENFEAAKEIPLLEAKTIEQLNLPPIKTTFEASPSTGPPPRVITWDLATQYKNGAYNGTYEFSHIDYALDVFGRYWNVDFQRVTRGGQYHVVQSNKLHSSGNRYVAGWTSGNTTYISPVYQFNRSKALSGMVACHEWAHVRYPKHHAQDGGLMGPNGGYLLLPSDYPAMSQFAWKGSLRPTDEPDFVKRYLSLNVVASSENDDSKLFPLLTNCVTNAN